MRTLSIPPDSLTLLPFSKMSALAHVRVGMKQAISSRRLKMKLMKIAALCLWSAGLAVAAAAQDVHTDFDRKATFERYHTYSWGKIQTSNPLWQSRIQDAVDGQLQAKGWQRVESGGDAVLIAVGATQNQQEYRTFYDGMGGWRWRGFGGTTTTTVETYKVGTLVIDIYDANNKNLVFRGTASDTLSENPNKNEKTLEKSVEKMFKKFPPDRS
jgi:hypothetical protein